MSTSLLKDTTLIEYHTQPVWNHYSLYCIRECLHAYKLEVFAERYYSQLYYNDP